MSKNRRWPNKELSLLNFALDDLIRIKFLIDTVDLSILVKESQEEQNQQTIIHD